MVSLRASTTQSRFSIWGQKLARASIKNKISIRFFIPGFHCQIENNKTQRGGARSAPPLWGGAEGAALLFSIWQWKPGKKTNHGDRFLLRPGPTFGPKLKTDFGWCWPLIKPPGALNETHCFLSEVTIILQATFGQHSGNFQAKLWQLSDNFRATFRKGQCEPRWIFTLVLISS